MQILGSNICTPHNGPSVPGQTSWLLTQCLPPDSLWGWTEAPPIPAAPYEAFDPTAAATFGHSQATPLCYGPTSYSPAGTLEPASSLETPGPGLPAYPTEDFTGQVRAR